MASKSTRNMSSAKSKNHRSGGKFTGSHTTLTDLSVVVADALAGLSYVAKIAIGMIGTGLPPAHGKRRVKLLADEENGYIRLVVRDNSSKQELHAYVDQAQVGAVKDALSDVLAERDIEVVTPS